MTPPRPQKSARVERVAADVIAALRLEFQTAKDVQEWVGDKARTWSRPPMRMVTGLTIETASGPKDAPYGSWIVGRADGTFDVLTANELAVVLVPPKRRRKGKA